MKNTILTAGLLLLTVCSVFAQGYRVNRTQEKTKAKIKSSDLGKNIIAFSPVNVAMNSIMNDGQGNVAVGISYERIFDNEMLSFKLPVNFTIQRPGIFLMPTIKLYPKKQGVVKYAVGPQFLISYVDESPYYYLYSSMSPKDPIVTRRQFGFALNNSLNFTISKHLYAGMEASLGILYYDSFNDRANAMGGDVVGLNLNQCFNAGFSLGCRF